MVLPPPARMLRRVPSAASRKLTSKVPTISGPRATRVPARPARGPPAAAEATPEQAREQITEVPREIARDVHTARAAATAEHLREGVGVEALGHAVGAHGRVLQAI